MIERVKFEIMPGVYVWVRKEIYPALLKRLTKQRLKPLSGSKKQRRSHD